MTPCCSAAIADDFTGATDLASMLVRGGMRTVQLIGVPVADEPAPDADAVVVALKSRTAPVQQAVEESLAALAVAARAGCRQFFFKYCSTFDSTDAGQYRPGRRRADRGARLRLRARLPGVPGQRAQRLPGPSVRRRRAAERERHGAPSADADDRRQPGARAVAPDRRHGRPGALRHGRAGRDGDPRRDDGAEGAGPPLRHRRCGDRRASGRDRRGRGAARADHRRLRRRDGPAGEFPPRRRCCRRATPLRCRAVTGHAAVLAGSCSRATLGQIGYAREHVPVLELDPLATPDARAAGAAGARLDRAASSAPRRS